MHALRDRPRGDIAPPNLCKTADLRGALRSEQTGGRHSREGQHSINPSAVSAGVLRKPNSAERGDGVPARIDSFRAATASGDAN